MILLLIIFFIVLVEKPQLIANVIHNIGMIRGIIPTILCIIPLLALFFNTDEIAQYINKRTLFNKNKNGKITNSANKNWWDDPKKRIKYKKKQLAKLNDSSKRKVAFNQGWKCLMCHNLLDESFSIDYNVSVFNGGSNTLNNLHALCSRCAKKKDSIENKNYNLI